MTEENYKNSFALLSHDLMMHLNEGIRTTYKATKNQVEPKFMDVEKPGKNGGMKAIDKYKYKDRDTCQKKSKWDVARSAIFDKFWLHY